MRFSKTSAVLFAAGASAAPTPSDAAAAAQPTHYLFTFGDSYSQTGFNATSGLALPSCADPMGNPAFPGYTTDNGVNWIGEIVQSAPGCFQNWNFAYGGATVNASLVTPYEPTVLSFIDQVGLFNETVAMKPAGSEWMSSNTAAAVWLGVNDVGNSWYYANYSAIMTADINSYFGQLQILYDAGVRKFLLLTTPPTYRSPLFISAGSSTVTGVKAAIPMWNSYLQEQAKAFGTMNSDATVQILDTTPIFNNILNHPRKFGAPNATCFDADGTSCLWWNNYHPGQAIQKAVGVGAYGQLFGKGSVGLLQS